MCGPCWQWHIRIQIAWSTLWAPGPNLGYRIMTCLVYSRPRFAASPSRHFPNYQEPPLPPTSGSHGRPLESHVPGRTYCRAITGFRDPLFQLSAPSNCFSPFLCSLLDHLSRRGPKQKRLCWRGPVAICCYAMLCSFFPQLLVLYEIYDQCMSESHSYELYTSLYAWHISLLLPNSGLS
jgi:hypothetical protein